MHDTSSSSPACVVPDVHSALSLVQVMLATQLNDMVRTGEVANGTVLRVEEAIANQVNPTSNNKCGFGKLSDPSACQMLLSCWPGRIS